jgi:SAM-dependent methyltransferase
VDLSIAVEANAQNFPAGDSHRIAQGDILRLPFAARKFDVVFCLGVIQHTPVPEETITALYDHVKPGGMLVVDHYTYSLGALTCVKPVFRALLKRLAPERTMSITQAFTGALLPLHKRFRNNYLAWFILSRFSPLTTFYRSYPDLSECLHREWALLDTHDSLTDWFKHRRTRSQIERLLWNLGLEQVRCTYAGNGVEARGRRLQ